MTPLCPNSRGAAPAGARGGFALLIMLALLALAVLLLLSLATLTRVETAVAGHAQEAAQARQNALMALQLAVGRLQSSAGPDRRVTARADVLPASTGNPFWTGVWDAGSASSGPLTWLVSGNEGEPLACTPAAAPVADPAPGNDAVWLLRAPVGAPDQRIKLAAQALHAADLPGLAEPRPVGHYAWWVGDEGVKAKYNLVNPAAGAAPGTPENLPQFMSAQQNGMEKLAAGFAGYVAAKGDTAAGAALRDRLGRVLAPNQIPSADPGVSLATLRDRFHDLTTYSRGVLANPRDGGLKEDLTRGLEPGAVAPEGAVFAGGPAWDLLRSFYQLRPAFADGGWWIAPRAQAPPQHGVHPLVLLVQVVWGGDRVDGRFRLLLQPMVVLGNPYDAALAPADYRLVWRQTGTIELRNPPAADDTVAIAGPPAQLLGEDPQFLIPQAGFQPGEARVFALSGHAVAYEPGAGLVLVGGTGGGGQAFRDLAAPAHPSAPELQVRVAGGTAGFELSLVAGGPLQAVTGCAANAPEVAGVMPLLGAPVRAGLRMGHDSDNATGDATGLRWLADFNLRAPVVGVLPAWGRNPLYNAATPRDGGDNTMLDGGQVFWGPSNRAAEGGQKFVTLYHLPRADLHSLAQLQHANLQPAAAGPGYGAGQAYADPHTPDGTPDFNYRLNEALWDRFFFSTLPADSAAPLNRRIVICGDHGVPPAAAALHDRGTAAAHLLVDGAFNINSTSVAAWQALLASLNGQRLAWFDPEADATVTATVGCALPRAPDVNGGEEDGWRGYRALTDAQLQALAAAIVDRVRAHGPFHSLAEFVNRPLDAPTEGARRSGLLQAALDGVANPPPSLAPAAGLPAMAGPSPGLAWPAASQGHRATLAPGWLSQADVLGVLGPVLAVRSDTFLVRAYGDAVNPATGAVTARAWCEAVVQRTPAYVDPADPPEAAAGLTAANQACGRRFEIVCFRWLASEEI
jgi:type II secretory pathway pseudopilin PulG